MGVNTEILLLGWNKIKTNFMMGHKVHAKRYFEKTVLTFSRGAYEMEPYESVYILCVQKINKGGGLHQAIAKNVNLSGTYIQVKNIHTTHQL